ncbi:Palmitoyltransferase [Trichostrongylus colubriformis]|uniref:Palmitoyltransferase n=1 Tax=Trichostrongylus colubriformis TaxID=6319 RepID=A0AAN8FZ08_TRICO
MDSSEKTAISGSEDEEESDLGMFVSAWQEDDEGILEGDLGDLTERFLKEAENGNLDAVKIMLQDNPQLLSSADNDGYTALHRAAYNNHVDVVTFLLEGGADAEARTNQGWTPLHSAANWGNYEVIGRLISHGVDVNARSNGSVTALHLAISSQCENAENVFHCVRYLLQAPVRHLQHRLTNGGMSCRFLIHVNRRLAKFGDLVAKYGGCVFLVFMLMSVFYVGLKLSCYSTEESDHCNLVTNFGVLVIIEILVNLVLFQYYSRHNCVSHWQRQACVAGLCRNAINIAMLPSQILRLLDELVWLEEDEPDIDPAYFSRFCSVCNRDAPIRSHHCPICKICVLRKDHHCFITGACVGLGNQRYFITFLFWCCIGLLLGVRYTTVYLYRNSENFPLGFAYCIGPVAVIRWLMGYTGFLHAFVCTVFSFMLASIVAAGAFFGMQIYYTCYGYTMYEYHSSVRDAFDGDGENLAERFRLIFGRYWPLNFLFPLCWNPQLLTTEIATNLFRVRSKQL